MAGNQKYGWFEADDFEKYRGRPKWHQRFRAAIYGILAGTCLFLAVSSIAEGYFFILFCGFITATIITILVNNMKIGRSI